MRSYLVVANKTLGGEALVRRLRELIAADRTARYFVLAPVATQPVVPAEIGGAMGGIAMIDAETQGYLEQEARDRVDTLVGWLSEQGVEAGGTTVVGDPLAAIERMVQTYEIDEIVVSTLPSRVSRWLRLDLVRRIERRVDVPVSTIVAADGDAGLTEPPAATATATEAATEAPAVVASPTRTRRAMGESVYKIIELVGTSTESWEKAASAAVATAARSLRDLRVAEISEMDLVIEDGAVVAYRAKIKVSFKYDAGDE